MDEGWWKFPKKEKQVSFAEKQVNVEDAAPDEIMEEGPAKEGVAKLPSRIVAKASPIVAKWGLSYFLQISFILETWTMSLTWKSPLIWGDHS